MPSIIGLPISEVVFVLRRRLDILIEFTHGLFCYFQMAVSYSFDNMVVF